MRITGSLTIPQGGTTASVYILVDGDYSLLDDTSNFESIVLTFFPATTQRFVTTVESTFNVTPTPTVTPSVTPGFVYSANTEYYDCTICDGTATTVTVPHPVWVNGQGQTIEILNSVQLGGMNGLNN